MPGCRTRCSCRPDPAIRRSRAPGRANRRRVPCGRRSGIGPMAAERNQPGDSERIGTGRPPGDGDRVRRCPLRRGPPRRGGGGRAAGRFVHGRSSGEPGPRRSFPMRPGEAVGPLSTLDDWTACGGTTDRILVTRGIPPPPTRGPAGWGEGSRACPRLSAPVRAGEQHQATPPRGRGTARGSRRRGTRDPAGCPDSRPRPEPRRVASRRRTPGGGKSTPRAGVLAPLITVA